MARNTTVVIPEAEWAQLTNADVTRITFQNQTPGQTIYVAGTSDATEPSSTDGAIVYGPGEGEANTQLLNLFPGLSAVRVWAYNDFQGSGSVKVFVSHA